MTKIKELINELPDMLQFKPATREQINDAQLQLGVNFSDEYKEYLTTFGAIMANSIELTGIAKSEHRNVVSTTKKERELNPNVPHTMYVIENTYVDGIIIWQDSRGDIYQSQCDSIPKKISTSLCDYISSRIK